ncbi:hypothetical protein [Aestuariimicrobium ganziense]|uniref:hypothetical protein n=1 Tax=Aestuariimicrobium ganziense TaxID=2773677 RepID=UPI0019406D70|nr:hypothetical protein [Aestuariimicrobium ganziense]
MDESTPCVELSKDDLAVVRTGVFGLLAALGAAGDSGLAGGLREVSTGSDAFEALPVALRDALGDSPSSVAWGEPPEDLEAVIEAAREVVARKLPDQTAAFDAALLYAAVRVADAAQGTSDSEEAVIDRLRQQLGVDPSS